MERVLAWWKRQLYQWGRKDFQKASSLMILSVVGIVICILAIICLLGYLDAGRGWYIAVAVFGPALLGLAFGAAFAIQWADERLKKSSGSRR